MDLGAFFRNSNYVNTMKRKAEIKVVANFVITGELTDAKWKKLVGDYFEPTGNNWSADHPWAIEAWAAEKMKEGMAQLLTKADVCMKMDHCGEGSQGQESFHVWLDDLEFDGIELTNSGAS